MNFVIQKKKNKFDCEEWIKTDYGEIKDKDLVDSIKHKVPKNIMIL